MDTYDQHGLPQHLLDTHAGDRHVSPSKVAKTEIETTNKPYKMVQEQIKQGVIKSSPIEDPGCQLAKAMITGVAGSDSKETDSDSKEAPSEQPPKEKASSSKSAGINCYRVDM